MTTRRWAWKQPSFEESVIAHWSSSIAPKMYRGSSDSPKRRDPFPGSPREAPITQLHSIDREVAPPPLSIEMGDRPPIL